ncbi:g10 protein family member protein [Theileria equi strain WA]|uniref:G10 protein family member protein n=1 Tax=Theileria equi strain WA TaxID=1537102 RepID=L0AW04_THEEQ|nr:g10 protein family member protein [Theileria equi strain WA]AFZ79079.1 g10 protein family member protein [Theileria equi strain WA]|eukprot:XP_004828745.1 g10 protein family member protein [Theileria equi strain WA]
MPRIKTLNTKPPPDGWDLLAETLESLDEKMKAAERESGDGKRRSEVLWPIFRIHHQRSRFIYEMFYQKRLISRELYDYCVKEGYADVNLIAKWRKQGFEYLCCLRCIQTSSQHFGTSCICRVPKRDLEPGKVIECVLCGCRGCASCDL